MPAVAVAFGVRRYGGASLRHAFLALIAVVALSYGSGTLANIGVGAVMPIGELFRSNLYYLFVLLLGLTLRAVDLCRPCVFHALFPPAENPDVIPPAVGRRQRPGFVAATKRGVGQHAGQYRLRHRSRYRIRRHGTLVPPRRRGTLKLMRQDQG